MLTDVQIRKAKPTEKGYRLTDSGGLHLFVAPTGAKLWRVRYEFSGKEKLLSLGPYPELSLADARKSRDEAKATLRAGRDPSLVKKQRRAHAARQSDDTFEVVAREWHSRQKSTWSEHHGQDIIRSLERDVFPKIGRAPIQDITAPEVLDLLRKVENRGKSDTARRIRQRISAVFVYAIAAGRASMDPAAIVTKAMAPVRKGRQPAITDLEQARQILRDVDAAPGYAVTKIAIRILALTAVRPGTLATTPWEEIDAVDPKDPVWRIPAARMKLKLDSKSDDTRDHLVPLSKQAVDCFDALRKLTGRAALAFPNVRHMHKPMSENAMGYMLNRAGYHGRHVPHGWRSTFSTVMNERFPPDRAVIDFMLAHVSKDKVESAYNRSAYLQRRKELAQIWADLIMERQVPVNDLLNLPRRG